MSRKKKLQKAQLKLAEAELKKQQEEQKAAKAQVRAERAAKTDEQWQEMKAARAERKARKAQQATDAEAAGQAPPKQSGAGRKVLGVGAAVVVLVIIISVFTGGDDDDDASAEPAQTAAVETDDTDASAEEDPAAEDDAAVEAEPEAEPEEPAVTAEEVEQALLDAFGADDFQSIEPIGWPSYIVDVEVPNNSLIVLTMQANADTPEIEDSSRYAFSLIGDQFETVNTLQVLDGAGHHIEQTHRHQIPMLND